MVNIKKEIKKITLFATIFTIAGCSFNIANSRKKSSDYKIKIDKYIESFVEDDFLIAAHRGLLKSNIENTIGSVKAANKQDYIDYIEIDVRLTKDGKFVISHDDDILKDSYHKIRISNSDYDNIINSKYVYRPSVYCEEFNFIKDNLTGKISFNNNIGLTGKKYRLTTLKDALKKIDKKVILDLKFTDNSALFIEKLSEEINKNELDNIIFQGKNIASMLCLKKEHPEYFCSLIVNSSSDADYLKYFDSCSVRKNLITDNTVKKEILKKDIAAVWSINNLDEVDSVIKNYPNKYKDLIFISDNPDLVATTLAQKEKKLQKN